MTAHIKSEKADIASLVIMPGDPLRAKYIAEKYLTEVKEVNNIRLNLAYTGYYHGKRITVFASGMGMPSMSIYATELIEKYDVKKIIRLGSCGSYYREIKPRDIILVEKAFTLSNYAYQQSGINKEIETSSSFLNQKVIEEAKKTNINIKIGNINTSDIFYTEYNDERIKDNFCLAVEMEAFALLYIAKKNNIEATAILTVSNNLVTNEELTSFEREQTFDEAIKLALNSIS